MTVFIEGSTMTCWILLRLNCVPPDSHVEALTPIPQNVTVFGDRTFKEGTS